VGAPWRARRGAGDPELRRGLDARLLAEGHELALAERAWVINAVAAGVELGGLGGRPAIDLAPAVDADQRRRSGVVVVLGEERLLAALAAGAAQLEVGGERVAHTALSADDRSHRSSSAAIRLAR
jgi:hypothetical protein